MANLAQENLQRAQAPEFSTFHRTASHEVICGSVRLLDFAVIFLAGQIAFFAYSYAIFADSANYDRDTLVSLVAAGIFVALANRAGLYVLGGLFDLRSQAWRGSLVLSATFAILATSFFITKLGAFYSRGWASTWVFVALAGYSAGRAGVCAVLRRLTRAGYLTRVIAVIGAGEIGARVVAKLDALADGQVRLAGIFDDRTARSPATVAGYPVTGTTDDLLSLARTMPLDEIVIALPLSAAGRIGAIVSKLRVLPVDLRVSIDSISDAFPMRRLGETASVRVVEVIERPLKHWSGVAKYLEDKLVGALLFLLSLPLLLVAAIAIRIESRGPVVFVQERFGYGNKPIRVWKLRTMRVEDGDPTGGQRTRPQDRRVTRVGRFLRQWSLDEVPQLWNVLCGDMSLVGPRPHAIAMRIGERLYHDAVDEYLRRHRVKPGITGWAQVNGLRGEIDTMEKARQRVAYDLYYIENWSLWFDLKILALTVWAVLSRQEAY